jgi:type II secretory pathway pseudopilin PulG
LRFSRKARFYEGFYIMRTKRQLHTGISLLEVLAAIFVMSIGLLGVLAVIPFGAFQVSKAQHAEYAANMLANAAEEIFLGEMVNGKMVTMVKPESWGVTNLTSGGTVVLEDVRVTLTVTERVDGIARVEVPDQDIDGNPITVTKIIPVQIDATWENKDTIAVLN